MLYYNVFYCPMEYILTKKMYKSVALFLKRDYRSGIAFVASQLIAILQVISRTFALRASYSISLVLPNV